FFGNEIELPLLLSNSLCFIDVSTDGVLDIAGTISGPGGLGKSPLGNGTLILSGSNKYSGETLISAGTLRAANNSALGMADGMGATGTEVLVGATLSLEPDVFIDQERLQMHGSGFDGQGALYVQGNNRWTGPIHLVFDSVIRASSGPFSSLSGPIDGDGG